MSDCVRCNRPAVFCAEHVAQGEREKQETIADLKSRLREVRALSAPGMGRDDIARLTDLRVKNWRGP